MNKLTNKSDCKAALRKACEDAAKYLPEPRGISDADVADIIERHLTPVFEALAGYDGFWRMKSEGSTSEMPSDSK
ncbi:MAG TPA: hypothetical protein VFI60_05815 [Candidatus Acidoferrum sp.]|nr:hypothetical protein [Candidatus Acidoferrum sp.]